MVKALMYGSNDVQLLNPKLENLFERSMSNPSSPPLFQKQLYELALISDKTTRVHWPCTRDSDIPVLRDEESGVVFLAQLPDLQAHYDKKTISKNSEAEVFTREGLLKLKRNDDLRRRLDQTRDLISGRKICDFGTGRGLFLDHAISVARNVSGVEIRKDMCDMIRKRLGDSVSLFSDITHAPEQFDVVTLFHVLEHIPDQIGILRAIFESLAPGGLIFVEVPHARDFLIEDIKSEAYCNFTFWSEHMVLHTKESLAVFMRDAGFVGISVDGFQRYGLANHLYWLQHRKPGGHEHYAHLVDDEADAAYSRNLVRRDRSDTLIAVARKPVA
ncbi:MAG: class I SAM-dependent methyltransferase [Roseibium sp.]|uniref:class I SAM-dependent methyltransferase n=1 Tax=Roseibium sp. TaxID=1936156 RepID=UPI00260E9520|nr:class I SAM-dependent methyltransferase [Roseibium sp.]MCV0427910.1 class I SAM-dependent methyltransferase [Roseibium sp.]